MKKSDRYDVSALINARTDLHVSTPAGRIIATICFAEVQIMTAFSGFAALLPVLAPEFGLNNSQAGLISGTVLGGYMAGVPFLGSLTTRGGCTRWLRSLPRAVRWVFPFLRADSGRRCCARR